MKDETIEQWRKRIEAEDRAAEQRDRYPSDGAEAQRVVRSIWRAVQGKE